MKKTIKKATTWLMIVCMILSFVSAFGSAAAAYDKPICVSARTELFANEPAPAALAVQPDEDLEDAPEQTTYPEGLIGVLTILFQVFKTNLQTLSVDDLLKLPASVMDDVVTYIFAALKMLGVDVGWLYEKILSILPLR